jgi:hypothetical protein
MDLKNYFYYFFSTVPQVLGAVLALFGVFVVFKVQTIQDDLLGLAKSILNRANNHYLQSPLIKISFEESDFEFLRRLDELIQRHGIFSLKLLLTEIKPNPEFSSLIIAYFNNYKALTRLIRTTIIWSSFTAFTIFSCIVIIASTNIIYGHDKLLLSLFILIILFVFICFCGLISILSKTLSDHSFRYLLNNYLRKKVRPKI